MVDPEYSKGVAVGGDTSYFVECLTRLYSDPEQAFK